MYTRVGNLNVHLLPALLSQARVLGASELSDKASTRDHGTSLGPVLVGSVRHAEAKQRLCSAATAQRAAQHDTV